MNRRVVIGVVVLVLGLLAAAVVVVTRDDSGGGGESAAERDERLAGEALATLAAGLETGDLAEVPLAGATPAEATAELEAVTADLERTAVVVTPGAVALTTEDGATTATGVLDVRWTLVGDVEWATRSTVDLERADDGPWQVRWSPAVVHPDLAAGDRLASERLEPARAPIVGADGQVLVEERDVVVVGVEPRRVQDVAALTAELSDALGIDGARLAERIAAAAPDAFVEVITLRLEDYLPVRDRIRPLAGTVFREETRPLGPNRTFARALLGTSGPVTAEVVEASDGRYRAGDIAGLTGMQAAYDEQLAGTNGVEVTLVRADPTPEGGTTLPPDASSTTAPPTTAIEPLEQEPEVLFTAPPVDGTPVVTTLDVATQLAADEALAGVELPSALVAVRPSTGEVLAVANGPAGGTTDLALEGRYPPGSSFKVVSTLALLDDGLGIDDVVDCPAELAVDGKVFRNAEGSALGPVPFRRDFAASCNTAFVGLAERFEPTTLTETARAFGIGTEWEVGMPAFVGSVPETTDPVEQAAASIGQARVEVSPLGMAMVAATVADGSWRPPLLVVDPAAPEEGGAARDPAAVPLPPAEVESLRTLMREVVTEGTGSAVAGVPGPPVSGKTGTAEFGEEVPPRSHAWFIAFQGDLAVACLVEAGEFGGETAAPVVARFLTQLAA